MKNKLKRKKIRLKFINNKYGLMDCIIKYAHIYTEPNYENYKKYIYEIDNTYGEFVENSYNNQ